MGLGFESPCAHQNLIRPRAGFNFGMGKLDENPDGVRHDSRFRKHSVAIAWIENNLSKLLDIFYFKKIILCDKIYIMKNVLKILGFFVFGFWVIDAKALFPVAPGDEVYIEITSATNLGDLNIANHGTITGISVDPGIGVLIQNYGTVNGDVNLLCNDTSCAQLYQIITGAVDSELDTDDMHAISNLSGHTVIVMNSANEISLADVIVAAGDASQIILTGPGVVVDVCAIGEHPAISFNPGSEFLANFDSDPRPAGTANSVSLIVQGITENWDETQPFLTGIEDFANFAGAMFEGVDSMFAPVARPYGDSLYVDMVRQTNYGIVFENDLGDWLDELRDYAPDDKLLGALDAARTRAGLRDVLSRSMRTNPIRLMDPVRSFNTFVLGEHIHDLAFGIVAEPFYIYSSDFSVLGGGAGVSGRIAKNLVAKFGAYAGKMDYDGDLDNFSGMIYGANFGAMYKDSDFYVRGIGTVSSAQFNDIEVFDGTRGVQNPNGISGAGAIDGGLVFRLFDEFDLTPFVGARFDYAHVLNFNNTDLNIRFGLNIDKEATVDGNKYAFGVQAVGQTNGEIYGAIYTDIMSVVDGVGGRLQFGILNDDFGLSYKIALDAKFTF